MLKNPFLLNVVPEYDIYMKKYFPEDKPLLFQEFMNIANHDNLFSSKWIADRIIESNGESKTIYSQKYFINYLKYILIEEKMRLFTSIDECKFISNDNGFDSKFINEIVSLINFSQTLHSTKGVFLL